MESFDQFEQLVRQDEVLRSFVAEVVSGAEREPAQPRRRFEPVPTFWTGAGAAVGVAAVAIYVLWRFAKIGLDRLQGKMDVEVERQRAAVIADIKDNLEIRADQAAEIEAKMYEQIHERSADDPVLRAAKTAFENAGQ